MVNIGVLHQQTRDEIGTEDTTRQIPKRFSEKKRVYEGPIVRETRDVSTDTIWGLSTWGGGVWDNTYDNQKIRHSVENNNNTYVEPFRVDVLKGALDTSNWDLINNVVSVDSGEVLHIESAFYDAEDNLIVSSATPTVTVSSGTPTIELSADGGSNWEAVTNNTQHDFTNIGSDLQIKITGGGSGSGFPTAFGTWGGSGILTVNKLVCEYVLN